MQLPTQLHTSGFPKTKRHQSRKCWRRVVEARVANAVPSVQLKSMECSIKAQIDVMDKAYRRDCSQQARKQQQRLISKHPKQANKEIFVTTSGQPRAGLQALQDTNTKSVETDHTKLKRLLCKSLKAVNPKNGKYLPEHTPRNYPWERSHNGTPDTFTLETSMV